MASPNAVGEPSHEAAHRPWQEKALSPGHLALPREAPRSRQLLAICQQPLRVAPSYPSGQREEMVAFDEWMRLAGPGPPPLRSLSSCQLLKPKPRARAHRCWACRAPGGVCRSAWLRNIGREKAFLPRSRGSSQERTVKPSGRTDEIVDCSRMSDAGEVYVTQTFRSGRLPIVRALFYLYALPMIGRSCSHCPAGHLYMSRGHVSHPFPVLPANLLIARSVGPSGALRTAIMQRPRRGEVRGLAS